jgi:hypothetical protein
MSTTTSLSPLRSRALTAVVALASLGAFGCASAADAGASSTETSSMPSPSRTTEPMSGGDACAHTTPGIYTNDADAGLVPRVGGECHYDETRGYVVVTSIENAPADEYN